MPCRSKGGDLSEAQYLRGKGVYATRSPSLSPAASAGDPSVTFTHNRFTLLIQHADGVPPSREQLVVVVRWNAGR